MTIRDTNDLFLRAAREKFRFASAVGELTAEQLWDLPLTSGRGASLDAVAKAVNTDLRAASEESFVVAANPNKAPLEAKLEIVKTIIAAKQDDARRKAEKAQKAETIRLLEAAIAEAQVKEITAGSKDELLARLTALKAEQQAA